MIVQFGGQTPLKLAAGLEAAGVPLLGTQPEAIDLAEDRGRFGALLDRLGLQGAAVRDRALARRRRWPPRRGVGFPLLVRPSYVLGGRAMEIVYSTRRARGLPARARAPHGREIFLDRFLENAIEVDVDAICDGEDVWIGGDHAARRGGRHPLRRLGLRAAAALARRARCSTRSARPRASSRSRSAWSG